jgi:hypothetical protein
MNPDKYAIIYNSKYDNNNDNIYESSANTSTIAAPISSSPYVSSTSTKPDQNHYYNEYHEGIIEIANSFLKILTNQTVDNTMVAAVKENKSRMLS